MFLCVRILGHAPRFSDPGHMVLDLSAEGSDLGFAAILSGRRWTGLRMSAGANLDELRTELEVRGPGRGVASVAVTHVIAKACLVAASQCTSGLPALHG